MCCRGAKDSSQVGSLAAQRTLHVFAENLSLWELRDCLVSHWIHIRMTRVRVLWQKYSVQFSKLCQSVLRRREPYSAEQQDKGISGLLRAGREFWAILLMMQCFFLVKLVGEYLCI